MKAQRFIDSRIGILRGRRAAFALMATPLLLEDGRVNIADERLPTLLRQPPAFRGAGVRLSNARADVHPTLRGLAAATEGLHALEVFRNGHVEFALYRHDLLSERPEGAVHSRLLSWAVAEYLWMFSHLANELRRLTEIPDPLMLSLAVFNCHGVSMSEAGVDMWGRGRFTEWAEGDEILLDPILVPLDEDPTRSAQRVADRFWNAFHFQRCPFFDADGRFNIPGR